MPPLPAIDPLYTLAGFFIGFIVGLTGVGGGSLMTPVLVLLFGIHPAVAVGTDLLYAAITKTAGVLIHGANKAVEWRLVLRLATGSVPAAALTVLLLGLSGARGHLATHTISIVLGAMLILTSLSLFLRRRIVRLAAGARPLSPRLQAGLTVLAGAVLGVLVSISSIGAGAIGVSALILLYPKLPVLRIVGSDIAHAVPLTLVAGTGHWLVGDVDTAVLLSLLSGSIPGIVASSFFAPKVNEDVLRYGLGAVLAAVGLKLIFG